MTSGELRRLLRRHGCTFETGKGGHLIVRRAGRRTVMPTHGKNKDLGKGLVARILKDLGIDNTR